MNEHTESAAAHIVRQHRTGFVAGIDFTDDSRFVEWASPAVEAESAILRAQYPGIAAAYEPELAEACTELGADEPVRQCLGRHVTDKVLAVLFGAAVAFVVLTWGSPL